jgi:hypothetical protein
MKLELIWLIPLLPFAPLLFLPPLLKYLEKNEQDSELNRLEYKAKKKQLEKRIADAREDRK